jgi:hypothetical protein
MGAGKTVMGRGWIWCVVGAITHGLTMIQFAATHKPDGIDFVGNSKISSFCLKSALDV